MITKEKIVKHILDMKKEYGDFPTREQWIQNGICNIKTLYTKCGTWTSLMVEIFGKEYQKRYMTTLLCLNCNSPFETKKYQKRLFCSSSCAATSNNKKNPKIPKTNKCKICGELILGQRTYCQKCFNEGKNQRDGKKIEDRTLREVSKYPGMARYNIIRAHARTITKSRTQICQKCGYNQYVQTCHIKPVKLFNSDDLVKTVNADENLVLLCPNCHWEMDHGLFKLVPHDRIELSSQH